MTTLFIPQLKESTSSKTTIAETATDSSKLSLSYLKTLTNIEDIQECLRILDSEENQVDLNLDELLEKRLQLESELDNLEVLRPQLGLLNSQATNLINIIKETSNVAERISAQVRQLDLEQSRVQEAINEVEIVQELKHCITGMHQSMYRKDYETAASYVNKAFSIDKKILNGKFAEMAAPSSEYPEIPTKTLTDIREALFTIFSREFDLAIQSKDEKSISRFFRLFPLIGKETEGLDKYSKFVCGIIADKSRANLAERVTGPNFYGHALNKLFENIAMIIDHHQPVVENHYGSGKMIRVIERLQEECDKQSIIIINSFSDERNLERKVVDVRTYNSSASKKSITNSQHSGKSSKNNETNPDPRELDLILSELAMISARSCLYLRFMESRAQLEIEAMKNIGVDVSLLQNKYQIVNNIVSTDIIKSSSLAKQLKSLMNDFVIMEEYFFRKAIEKAMSIDNYEEVNKTSSCVGDVFYILKECLNRAISTSDVDCLTTIVNQIIQSLENDYITLIQRRLFTSFAATESKDAKMGYMILLNNLDVSCDYMQRLTSELTSLPSIVEEDYEKIQKSFNCGLEQLFTQMIKQKLRPILQEAYKDIKYVLNEDEYHEQEANDGFAKRFVIGFDNLIKVYQTTFTENNYNQIMIHIIESLTNMWEKTVFGTRFNQFGALRFDKDLRSVTNYFLSKMQWPFRDRFTRLNQISILLNLETIDEIHEYWGGSSKSSSDFITWRLTVMEVKRIVGLRVDFNDEEISTLKL
ncbi:9128_t:CDS:10 [Entrophospora sp. SA101]|nr:9128_t:CDS:10 [Entrophospora sp. SA101]